MGVAHGRVRLGWCYLVPLEVAEDVLFTAARIAVDERLPGERG